MSADNRKRRECTRREFLAGAAGTAAALVLSACGANPTATPVPTSAAPANTVAPSVVPKVPTIVSAAGKVSLMWWTSLSGAVAKALEDLAKDFNAKDSGIEIKVVNQGSYATLRDKLLAAAAAKQMPDLVLVGSRGDWVPFARNNLYEPLDDYIKSSNGIDLKDYFPFVDRGVVNGRYYQLPIQVSAPLLYVNSDMVKAAGVPMPTEKWTYDQHYDFFAAMTVKEGGKVKVYGHAYRSGSWNQQQEIWAYGSRMSDDKYNLYLDSPEMIAQWKKWQKASAGGHSHIPTKAEGSTLQMFSNKLAATAWASTGSLQRFEDMVKGTFKWTVLAAPYGPKGRFVSEGGGGISITAGLPKEKKDAAWSFVKFTQEPEQVAFFAKATGYLAHTSKGKALIGDFLKENPLFQVAYDALSADGRRQEQFRDSARAETLIEDALDRLAESNEDVEKALKQLQKDATAVMVDEGFLKT